MLNQSHYTGLPKQVQTRPNRSTRSVDQTQKTCHESDKRFKRDIQYVKVNLEALTNTQKI